MTIRIRHVVCLSAVLMVLASGRPARAQAAPAPAPSADTPSIRIGAVLFTDATYAMSPESTDADGNPYHLAQFNVGRTYLNITGSLNHIVNFRITPDLVRETGNEALAGSLSYRLKYGFAQVNLDDWVGAGAWVRFGIQQTPLVDFEENVYRYRFQGTVFAEREGYLSSSDAGVSARYNMPSNYGEVHIGVYNGENFNRTEADGFKALEVRGSMRPFAHGAAGLRGLRVHGFLDADHYVKDGPRRRADLSATFENPHLNAGVEYLSTDDRPTVRKATLEGHGYSAWATPRAKNGLEGLLRFDHMTPDLASPDQTRTRTIVGAAYWFPHQGPVSSAVLVDYDGQTFHHYAAAPPKQQRVAVHALVNF